MKAVLKDGYEWDAFSKKSRRLIHMSSGRIKWIKRKFWKRERKAARMEIKKGFDIR